NQTFASEFILLGFTAQADLQMMFFVLFFAIYVVTVLGNLGVIVLIWIDLFLHTPMYFFLSHLSLLDICHSSTIIPWSLRDFLAEKKVISLVRCLTQLFSFSTWATAECYVLAATAYGCYVATCRPLLYSMLMSQRICVGMLSRAYLAGVIGSTLPMVSIFHAPFCRSRAIRHFFCSGSPLMALSHSNTCAREVVVAVMVGFNALSTVAFILVSCLSVLTAVLRIRPVAGRHKASSTCASRPASVALYYGSAIPAYLRPVASHSLERDKVGSLLDSVAVPALNPFVYDLGNVDLRNAVRKAKSRI
ncbi:O1038 protein, partial [Dryoscopus gambensis]|nr:O1038 protein [Dryoscopus gambensis]